MDNVDKATRPRYMAAVKSRGNLSTERGMVLLLRGLGIHGWRRHYRIEGTPDFCWPRLRIAMFLDGCFWHGCPRCYRPPKSHVRYWTWKVAMNRRRDRRVDRELRRKGWRVLRIWECRLSNRMTIARLRKAVRFTEVARLGHADCRKVRSS